MQWGMEIVCSSDEEACLMSPSSFRVGMEGIRNRITASQEVPESSKVTGISQSWHSVSSGQRAHDGRPDDESSERGLFGVAAVKLGTV